MAQGRSPTLGAIRDEHGEDDLGRHSRLAVSSAIGGPLAEVKLPLDLPKATERLLAPRRSLSGPHELARSHGVT